MRRLSGWSPTRCFYLYLASRILHEPVKSSISRRVSEECDPATRLDSQPVVAPLISRFFYHVNDLTAIQGDSALHARFLWRRAGATHDFARISELRHRDLLQVSQREPVPVRDMCRWDSCPS